MSSPAALQLLFDKARNMLEKTGMIPIKIISGSMEPVIKVNQTVIITKVDRPLARFDIIVFKGDQGLICHYVRHVNRIVTTDDNDLIQTRGLNSKHNDVPIHRDQVLGIVISHRLNLWRKLREMWAIR